MERQRRLGVLLRAHRNAAGLTQRQLADRAGVSVGAVQDIEQGRTVSSRPGTLARLAAALDLSGREREEMMSLSGAHGGAGPALSAQPAGDRDGDGALRLTLLGPFMAWRDGAPVALGPARQQAVLGLLALYNGTGLSRAAIVDALWGSDPPPAALAMVQGYVSRIRRLLGPAGGDRNGRRQPREGGLSWDGTAYRLAPGAVWSDLDDFGALAERARQAGSAGESAAACQLYEQSLQLWRGEPLAGIEQLQGDPAVIELRRRRASVVIEYSDAVGAVGQHQRVVGYLRALAQQEPLDERVHARLMIALSALGQQAAGLRLYEDLRLRLDGELGVRPGQELADAHMRVLRQDFTTAAGRAVIVPDGTVPGTGGKRGRAGYQGPAAAADPVVPHQLPAPAPHFAGRAAELSALDGMLGQADREPGTVVITAVGGTAGVGKTVLAVHWAHRIAGRFPDGQLYVNLRGYGPSRGPVAPAEAISGFLDALRVPPERIPAGLDARAGLYRSLLAGKRMLIVLDNARSADQVRPLLPGSPACLVVVTSRSHLAGLATAEGAYPLVLDILTHADARTLLATRLDPERLAAEPQATDEMIGLCARLPLALSVAAARAARHPGFPLAAIVADLRDERHRLDALETGDGATAVRAVFSWSYRLLNEPAARLFRLLGVYPGPDITGPAAASLAGVPAAQALRTLGELARSCLLTEHVPGRFACHDLLRAYAAELARARRRGDGQQAALHRVLDHYLYTCNAADRLMYTSRDPITLAPASPGVIPESFTSLGAARAWYLDEYPALVAAVTQAARGGFSSHAWQISWAAETFIHRRASWQDFAPVQEVALVAAQRQRDRAGEAHMRSALGRSRAMLGSLDEAHRHLSVAIGLFQQLADRGGEATARIRIGLVSARQGHHADARAHAQQAFELYRSTGNRTGQAGALNNVGWYAIRLGQHEEALTCCQEALGIFRELGDRYGEGIAQGSIGSAYLHLGRHAQCLTHCQASYDLLKAVGESYQQGHTLDIIGDAHYATRNRQAAQQAWQQALDFLDPVGEPAATQIREKLRRIR
jgi:DNA-binding SARP family transcriptional activator/tetratricopeptide (TPR) repeat protein/DNA-binding XRE family transcriptional regulator